MSLYLLTFILVATITPGAATSMALATGAQRGFSASLPLLGGMTLGLAIVAGLAALGIGRVLADYPLAHKLCAVFALAYCLYLACRIAPSGRPDNLDVEQAPGFVTGLLLNPLNPKAWAMALAAAAAFETMTGSVISRALLLASLFAGVSFCSLTIWCLGGSQLRRIVRTRKQWHWINSLLAVALLLTLLPMVRELL